MRASRRVFVISSLILLCLATACSNTASSSDKTATTTAISTQESTNPASTSTPPPASTAPIATPGFSLDPDGPNGERILELVRALSVNIGPHPAGSDNELAAAQYIAGLLRSFGYNVELQEFPIGREVGRQSALKVNAPQERTIPSVPFANSGTGAVTGVLVAAGLGYQEDIPPEAQNAILLIERGELFFQEKVANAQAAGALGVVIYNNEPGSFFGSLQTTSDIPALSISRAEGQLLAEQISNGTIEVEVSVAALSDAVSFNVIARPPDTECETVAGGHYDSVVQAAGASDNASGTATVIEIAAVLAAHGP